MHQMQDTLNLSVNPRRTRTLNERAQPTDCAPQQQQSHAQSLAMQGIQGTPAHDIRPARSVDRWIASNAISTVRIDIMSIIGT
ncbi:MAG TPA: hypothetical protein DCQ04_06840 [Actinobacteria bacterium]|nr:hypothetical protein [Actinomycetota bacterium]